MGICYESRTFSHLLYEDRTTSDTFITGPYHLFLMSQADRCQVCGTQRHGNLSYMVGMQSAILHSISQLLGMMGDGTWAFEETR
jgi:hypothetical protein